MSDPVQGRDKARVFRRNPDSTRRKLLEAAAEEIFTQGFRTASLDNILKKTGVTKGALYHHFPNKQALGYAVLEELIFPEAATGWEPLWDESLNPIDALTGILEHDKVRRGPERANQGCPINNLVQEMSGVDEGFRERLMKFQRRWILAVEKALLRGQAAGQVRADVDALQTATLLVASYEGCAGIAKVHRDKSRFASCVDAIIVFLNGLRA